MVKSVRLDPELEARLRLAASILGVPESTLIRTAIEEQCHRILQERLDGRLADVIGIVQTNGGRARESGERFRELLRQRALGQ